MKIRNAIIITNADTKISMTLEEQADFNGNVVVSQDKLSVVLADTGLLSREAQAQLLSVIKDLA